MTDADSPSGRTPGLDSGDAGSSPASAAEHEFAGDLTLVHSDSCCCAIEGGVPARGCLEVRDFLRAAHRRALQAAYDRGFKDASALAANSVRQAREEVEDWILDHWSHPCVHDDSAECFHAMRGEFERRAAIPLDKPAE